MARSPVPPKTTRSNGSTGNELSSHRVSPVSTSASRISTTSVRRTPIAVRQQAQPVADDLAVGHARGAADLEAHHVGDDAQARPSRISGTPPERR